MRGFTYVCPCWATTFTTEVVTSEATELQRRLAMERGRGAEGIPGKQTSCLHRLQSLLGFDDLFEVLVGLDTINRKPTKNGRTQIHTPGRRRHGTKRRRPRGPFEDYAVSDSFRTEPGPNVQILTISARTGAGDTGAGAGGLRLSAGSVQKAKEGKLTTWSTQSTPWPAQPTQWIRVDI